MGFIKNITAWFNNRAEEHRKKRIADHCRYMESVSSDEINVMEFNGKIHISYRGVPIVPVDNLNVETIELLENSRKTYIAWKNKFEH